VAEITPGSRWEVLAMATRRVGGGTHPFVVEVIEHERAGAPGYDDLVPTVVVKPTHTRRQGAYGGTERGYRAGDVTWLRRSDFRGGGICRVEAGRG
jgi:hypothetical protein